MLFWNLDVLVLMLLILLRDDRKLKRLLAGRDRSFKTFCCNLAFPPGVGDNTGWCFINHKNVTVKLLLFVAVCVRVPPVQRQHLQVIDVRLSSSGGRTDFPHAAISFFCLVENVDFSKHFFHDFFDFETFLSYQTQANDGEVKIKDAFLSSFLFLSVF